MGRIVTRSYGEFRYHQETRGLYSSPSGLITVLGPRAIGGKGGGTAFLDARLTGRRDFSIPSTIIVGSGFFPVIPREITPSVDLLTARSLTSTKISDLINHVRSRLGGPLAIRSSSPVEDLGGSVAAGIFETEFDAGELGSTSGRERFVRKLLFVLNSAYARRAQPYWQRQGYDRIPQIPVMIQEVVGRCNKFVPHYYLPEIAGIINTSMRTMSRVSTVLGLGLAAVNSGGAGLLHQINPHRVTSEGELNRFGLFAVNLKTGDFEFLTGPRAEALFPPDPLTIIQRRFPQQQIALAQLANELGGGFSPKRCFDVEFAAHGRQTVITQARPVSERRVLSKPSRGVLFETSDLIGYCDSKRFSTIIRIKCGMIPSQEVIGSLLEKFPRSMIILDTDVLYTMTSNDVSEAVIPYVDALLVIDRKADAHQWGTGIQHFSLNLANEQKVLLYAANDHFMPALLGRAAETEKIDMMFSSAEIIVYKYDQPITIVADDVARWGVAYAA